ncbi:MAG: PD-(D/E)XK nuclease family protein [Clostridia bacterium]|nr:PD-(D/E)XK nuclease family protein [Clostridia bacterium]
MLKIIKSGFCSLGHERIKEEIQSLVESGKRTLLIVPEQQTVVAESEMADVLPHSAALCFEVTNFTRLANSTARALGGISGEYCDNTRRALIMWRTLTELSSSLVAMGVSRGVNEGLVNRALAAVGEMQSLGISPQQLAESAASERLLGDGRLKGKLHDLYMIFSLYKNLLAEKYADTGDDCTLMLKSLKENPDYLKGYSVFVEGFTSFTEPQYKIIAELSGRLNLTVLLNVSKAAEDSFEYSEIRGTEARLKSDGRRENVNIKLMYENSPANVPDSIRDISDVLWRNRAILDNISLQNKEEIRIFEAREPFEECDFIASDIKRRLMGGASLSDFAIVARDVSKYEGILDASLKSAEIPAFISRRRDVSGYDAIKLIYSAYSVIRSHFSRESLITYAKCPLSPITKEECDELEIYAEVWQINGSRFTDSVTWNMNPDGYSTRHRPEHKDKLLRINSAREALITPLLALEADVKAAKTVKEQAEALYSHLTALDMERALRERAAALEKIGEGERAAEVARLFDTICRSLDTLVSTLGDTEADGDTFLSLLKISFGGADIARIPAYYDEVTVGSADMLRLYGKKHVYLMGVNSGEFPGLVNDSSYFSEKDKSILSELGLAIHPELEVKGARELYVFTRALTYAKESVTLTYSTCDTKFKARERSDVIAKISRLCRIAPIRISDLPKSLTVYTKEGALLSLADTDADTERAVRSALHAAGVGDMLTVSDGDITNSSLELDPAISSRGKDSPISLTQSRIDSYTTCPLSYFCKYTLSLSEAERAEFNAANIGTFIHSILENVFLTLTRSERDSSTLTADEREELTRDAAKKYVSELGEGALGSSSLTKIKLERLVRASLPVVEGLCEEFAASRFKPRFFELAITASDPDCPEPVITKTKGGRDVYIYGYIDRVDTYERDGNVYVRVVDYKTGHKEFSPDDLADGKNLQMFLYLKSILDSENEKFKQRIGLSEGGRLIPAGVIYVKTAIGDQRVDSPDDSLASDAVKSAQGREGMVLDDEHIISAMDMRYTPLYSKRTPDKIPDSKKKYLFSEESFADMMDGTLKVVSDVADRIYSGDIKARPRVERHGETHCDVCEFKPLCRSKVITEK